MANDAAAATDTMADDAAQSETDAAAEWRDKFLRLQAEFDNYRKRTLREDGAGGDGRQEGAAGDAARA